MQEALVGKSIVLKFSSGYLKMDGDGSMGVHQFDSSALTTRSRDHEIFSVLDGGDGTIALHSPCFHRFVRILGDGGEEKNPDELTSDLIDERFLLEKAGNGKYSLRNPAHNRCFRLRGDPLLDSRIVQDQPDESNLFEIVRPDNGKTIVYVKNKWVNTDRIVLLGSKALEWKSVTTDNAIHSSDYVVIESDEEVEILGRLPGIRRSFTPHVWMYVLQYTPEMKRTKAKETRQFNEERRLKNRESLERMCYLIEHDLIDFQKLIDERKLLLPVPNRTGKHEIWTRVEWIKQKQRRLPVYRAYLWGFIISRDGYVTLIDAAMGILPRPPERLPPDRPDGPIPRVEHN